jgi:hypothetical protein
MIRLDDPPYLPGLSPCGIWLFGVSKNRMKETVFGNSDKIVGFVCNFWTEVPLDEVQLGRHEWMRQLEWFCAHDG